MKWDDLLKVNNPTIERIRNAYRWFVEIIKSGVIWGCELRSPVHCQEINIEKLKLNCINKKGIYISKKNYSLII